MYYYQEFANMKRVATIILSILATATMACAQSHGLCSDECSLYVNFQDKGIEDFCLRAKGIDADKDGKISIAEAAAVEKLSLMSFKSFIRSIKSYEDLKYFPNIEYFHAGFSYADTLDLSHNPKLKEIDCSDCRNLKVILLPNGCKSEIKQGYWNDEAPVVKYVKIEN